MRSTQNTHRLIQNLVLSALFAAAITVMTAYILHIPIPTGGYIHLGDALIYLAACLLPMPCAAAAAAIGAGLADLLTAPEWFVATLVIKAALVPLFTNRGERILCGRNCVAMVLAGVLSPTAYALYACAMFGTMTAFVPQFLGTLLQGVGSGVLFVVIAPALDGAHVKARLTA